MLPRPVCVVVGAVEVDDAPVLSVSPYRPIISQPKVRTAALSVVVVIGDAPYAIERSAE